MVIYSPRLLICLQEECTVGRERGHWNQTFPQSLQTLAWRYTKSQALSTLSSMVSATCCYFLPFLSIHKGTDTLAVSYLRTTQKKLVRSLSARGNHHCQATFRTMAHLVRAVFWAAVTWGSFPWLMRCTLIPTVWTIFKRECFFFLRRKVCMIFLMWIEKLYSPQILETCN